MAAFTFSPRWSPGPSHTTLVDATPLQQAVDTDPHPLKDLIGG